MAHNTKSTTQDLEMGRKSGHMPSKRMMLALEPMLLSLHLQMHRMLDSPGISKVAILRSSNSKVTVSHQRKVNLRMVVNSRTDSLGMASFLNNLLALQATAKAPMASLRVMEGRAMLRRVA